MDDIGPRPARIAYVDPQGVAGRILPDLEERFKSVNVNWSVHMHSSRISAAPQVVFQPVDRSTPQHQVLGFMELPLVQILLIDASKADYKPLLRPLAHDWRRQMLHSREPAGYIVVHYAPKGTSGRHSGWSKIIHDFPDHAVQLYLNTEQDSNSQWFSFLEQLRNEVTSAFEARVELYEAEISRLQEIREVVGWNFGALFTAKEGLASCMEQMGLFNEAYNLYCQLDKITEPQFFLEKDVDLETDPFSIDREWTLDAALTQKLSLFEYTRYLISRQLILLLCMAQSSNVASIAAITRAKAVRQGIICLPRLLNFLPADARIQYGWQLKWVRELNKLGAKEPNLLAELTLLERDAIQGLALTCGLPVPGIFNDVGLDSSEDSSASGLRPSEGNVTVSVDPQVATEKDLINVFISLTEKAIARFKQSGNQRSILRLTAQIIFVYYALERYQICFDMLEAQNAGPSPAYLESSFRLLEIHAKCASEIGRTDRVLRLSWEILSARTIEPALTNWCIENIAELADNVPGQISLEKWFSYSIVPYIRGIDGDYHIEVDLKPKRRALISLLDRGELTASVESDLGSSKRRIKFTCCDFNSLNCRFKANQFVQGRVRLLSISLFIKKQRLAETLKDIFVVMKPLTNCLYAKLQPMNKFTTKKRWLKLTVKAPAGRQISSATANITGQNLEILHDQMNDEELKEAFSEASATFPVLYNPENPIVSVRIALECQGGYTYEFSTELDFGLQVLVQMQDLFRRGNTVYSHFFVEPMKIGSPVALCGASLKEGECVGNTAIEEHIAFNKSPVSYVFRLNSERKILKNQLRLVHRPLIDEIRTNIWGALEPRIFADDIASQYSLLIEDFVRLLPLDAVTYATQGRPFVDLAAVNSTLGDQFQDIEQSHVSRIFDIVHDVLSAPIEGRQDYTAVTLELEVEVPEPEADIIFYVSLDIPEHAHYLVGQAISAALKIDILHRSQTNLDNNKFEYSLDNVDGWYFSGRTQGCFTGSFTENITLIPYRPGSLLLPEVSINMPKDIPTEVVPEYTAQRVFVVPEVNKLAVSF